MSTQSDTLFLGAVAYDPKVVTIWDGFQRFFGERGLAFDYVLYTNYERQVEGHFEASTTSPGTRRSHGSKPNGSLTPRQRARAIAMRDTDRDLTSVILVKQGDAIRSPLDLKGKRVAVGAEDSPQATILPLHHLAGLGLEPRRDFEVMVHDVLVGKHGDHIGGEPKLRKRSSKARPMLRASSTPTPWLREGRDIAGR